MVRRVLSDRQWEMAEPICLGKKRDPGRTGQDGRQFLEAVLWIARTGSPWRDLPAEFGNWNTVFQRFRYWAERGVFERIFEALSGDPDLEYAMIDGTIISAHQKASGANVWPAPLQAVCV